MEAFTFTSPVCDDLRLSQSSTGTIGAKIYPGALLMARLIEEAALTPLAAVAIEVGAGACPIPTLLASASGVPCYATDLADMLGLCEANLVSNAGVCVAPTGTLPLPWGHRDGARALRATVAARHASSGHSVGVILGADVVYHDHLIQPLLETLAELTDPPADSDNGPASPPRIVLTYVQRFKRSKSFFKIAAKGVQRPAPAEGGGESGAKRPPPARFDVEQTPLGLVVDYDTLSWVLPMAARLAGGGGGGGGVVEAGGTPSPPVVVLRSGSSSYVGYCQLLVRAAAAAAAAADAGAVAGMETGGGEGRAHAAEAVGHDGGRDAPAHRTHRIDSDSGDEWDDSAGYATALLSGLSSLAVQGSTEAETEGECSGAAGGQEEGGPRHGREANLLEGGPRHGREAYLLHDHGAPEAELVAAARASAGALGLRFASPLKAYRVTLVRKA